MPRVGPVRIRSITSLELSEYQTNLLDDDGDRVDPDLAPLIKARFIVMCVVDENGDRLFADADDELVAGYDSAIVDKLYEACTEHSGIDNTDIEEAAKNSEMTTSEDLPSD